MNKSLLKVTCDVFGLFYIFMLIYSCISIFLLDRINFIGLIFSLFLSVMLSFLLNFNKENEKTKKLKIFFVFLIFYFIVFCSYLYVYPFFLLSYSVNLIGYLLNSLNFLNKFNIGIFTSSDSVISLLLAGWLSLGFDNVLFFSRVFIGFVIWSSLPFVYFIGDYVTKEYGGVVASLLYVVLNPFLYLTFVSGGFFVEAFGLTFGLATIYWFMVSLSESSGKRLLFMPFFGYALLLVYSFNFLIALSLVFAVVYLIVFERRYSMSYFSFKLLVFLFFGVLFAFLMFPWLFAGLSFSFSSSFVLISSVSNPFLTYLLRNIPVLECIYLFSEENVFVLVLFLITFIFSCLYFFKKSLGFGAFPFAWLILIVLAGFFSNVWTFALSAFAPFCLLSPLIFERLLLPLSKRVVNIMPSGGFRKIFKYLVAVFCFVLLFLSSYSNVIVPLYASSWSRPQQEGFYECLVWFRDYSESDAVVVSVGGGTYMRFLPVVANRTFLNAFPGVLPEVVYDALKNYSNGYVVVWNRLHPYNGSYYYIDFYKNCSLFKEVWTNSEVTVFKLVKKE